MIKKPTGYDEATAYTGEYETLQPGGHICVIKGATVMQTRNGTEMLKIAFDIDESDPQKQGGFYGRQFESNKAKYGPDTKWPSGGTHRIGIDGKSVPFFKGFMELLVAMGYNAVILEIGAAMELKRHPELNEYWLRYSESMNSQHNKRYLASMLNPRMRNSTHTFNANGEVLSQKEVRELVDFGHSLGLEMIPEIPSLSHSEGSAPD